MAMLMLLKGLSMAFSVFLFIFLGAGDKKQRCGAAGVR